MQIPTVKVEKAEVPHKVAVILCAMVLPQLQSNRPVGEKHTWGLNCSICKKEEEEGTEDWNGDRPEN